MSEDTKASYDTVARLFHWTIVVMVAIQIPAGIAMTSEPLARFADPLFILHKGMGVVLGVLVMARIVWRLTHAPPPFPAHIPRLEQRIAHATHVTIYALLVVMVVSGYVRTIGDGFPIEMLDDLGVPPLIPFMPRTAAVMLVVHQFAVFVLVALVVAHVSAVLMHQVIQKDGTLRRMWPPWRPRGGVRSEESGGS